MPIDRFYVADLPESGIVEISGVEHHHLAHVMRLHVGQQVELVDGRGALATALVAVVGRHATVVEVRNLVRSSPPPFLPIIAQALPRQPHLETIVEKGTELGMAQLWLFPAERSARNELNTKQIQRLEAIAVAALKQCGRLHLPQIISKGPISSWEELPYPLLWGCLDPHAPTLLEQSLQCGVIVAIGPESGFSPDEEAWFSMQYAQGVRLHRNILRTETASLAALSIIEQMIHCGD